MKIIVLASGSKGNATYIETKNTKILIDAGISYLQLRNRLFSLGISLKDLDVILLTHEHVDHIKHLSSIALKTNAQILMSEITYPEAFRRLSGSLSNLKVAYIEENKKYKVKDLYIVPIKLSHDVDNCFGFIFKEESSDNKTFGYITDTGYIPEEYLSIISQLQVVMIESNHDVDMLKKSKRPWPLIQRILSDIGHLSNKQCVNYLKGFDYNYVKTIILAHVSEECNDDIHIIKELNNAFECKLPCKMIIAKQHEPLDIIEV